MRTLLMFVNKMAQDKKRDAKTAVIILLGSAAYAGLNSTFVFTAAAGVWGPVWPDRYLTLAGIALVTLGATVGFCVGRRVAIWSTLGSGILLAGTVILNLWAAAGSFAAV